MELARAAPPPGVGHAGGGHERLGGCTKALVGLLLFLGVGGFGGGAAMIAAPGGALIGMDPAIMDAVPLLETWLVPGLFLSLVLGVLPLATAWTILRRPLLSWAQPLEQRTHAHVGWSAALGIGITLVLFIGYEAQVVTAPEGRPLQIVMAITGLAIAALALSTPVRRDLRR